MKAAEEPVRYSEGRMGTTVDGGHVGTVELLLMCRWAIGDVDVSPLCPDTLAVVTEIVKVSAERDEPGEPALGAVRRKRGPVSGMILLVVVILHALVRRVEKKADVLPGGLAQKYGNGRAGGDFDDREMALYSEARRFEAWWLHTPKRAPRSLLIRVFALVESETSFKRRDGRARTASSAVTFAHCEGRYGWRGPSAAGVNRVPSPIRREKSRGEEASR